MSNPILNDDRFSPQERILDGEPMTVSGTMNKVIMLFACLIAGACIGLYFLFTDPSIVANLVVGGGVIGFLLVFATSFNISIAKYLINVKILCLYFLLFCQTVCNYTLCDILLYDMLSKHWLLWQVFY